MTHADLISGRKRARARRSVYLAGLLACLIAGVAWGDSVVQFMTAKSLPDATVAVIDPESGTSDGTVGSDVNIAVGDIILFRFAVASAPASGSTAMRGIQSYVTEYIPPGTELVGARLVDAAGNTIEPRPAGLALDGCGGGALCNSAPAGLQTGSIAQVYADTGIFFTTLARPGSPVPVNQFLTLDNGITMTPSPAAIDPSVVQILNDTTDPYNAHNNWDNDQMKAFGQSTSSPSNGDGNTPQGYGSPVAGPQTHYAFEVNANGTLTNVVGPWQRVKYPGSQIGTGVGNIGATNNFTRVGVETATGFDLTPATPQTAQAVRFALGEAQVGELRFVEVALRVKAVPIDPTFGTSAGNVDCGETFGGDISSKSANTGGNTNPWPTFVPHPQCVFLRLKFDLTADRAVASVGQLINYTVSGKNLSVANETNARVVVKFVSSDQALISTVPAPTSTAACPAPDTNRTCLTFNRGTLAPSAEFTVKVTLDASGTGKRTNVVLAQYLSDELTAIDPAGYTTTAMTVVSATQLPRLTLANVPDVTTTFAAAGSSNWEIAGTVINDGNSNWTSDSFTIVLPAATFGLRNAAGTTANQITVGGVNFNCTTTGIERVCNRSDTYTAEQSRTIGFRLVVPAGQATGLYTVGIKTFGDQFETFVPKAVVVPVGAVRTQKPILACPIAATQPAITGTSEGNASVKLLFNLLARGTATANGAGAWSTSNYAAFGELYAGLEVRGTAQVTGELESELSVPCTVSASRACSDGFDNDGDGLVDFPSDPGCSSPTDNSEANDPQCSDRIDNNGDGRIDWPADPSCNDALDNTENGVPACRDGIDDDLDLLVDLADPDCNGDPNGVSESTLQVCQNRRDDDADALVDFTPDTGCHAAFDTSEFDGGITPIGLPPRLLVVFDTSGSMNFNTCTDNFTGGDGSEDFPGTDVSCNALRTTFGCQPACSDGVDNDGDTLIDFPADPGCSNADDNDETATSSKPPAALTLCDNGLPDDSRLFQVKAGISQVVANFGEVDWGLMRFQQRPVDFQPPTASAGGPSGGWQGGGAAPCQSFNAGELLVSFSFDNPNTIIDFLDGKTNYETVPPPALDEELRGTGTTPIAGSLQSAKTYVAGVKATDPRTCRPYRIVLVTDGLETCGGDPVATAASSFAAGLPVVVIGFSTGNVVARNSLNAIARAGSGNASDAIFVDDQQALAAAFSAIVNETLVFEKCNGLDDDCDGSTDEDFVPPLGNTCNNKQLGVCARDGAFQCTADGTGTVCNAPTVSPPCADETCAPCNAQDDDCDGKIDEGLTCSCQTLELCNGIDDDCDGIVDEDSVGIDVACGSDIGVCAPGTVQCVDPDGNALTPNSELQCTGGIGPAANDACDGRDNDCDTRVDEDPGPRCYDFADGGCVPNGSGDFNCQGTCSSGVRACTNGSPGACVNDRGAQAEICDGLDNSCNGIVDDPWKPDVNGNPLGGACTNGQLGVCRADGQFVCNALNPASPALVCNAAPISPGTEVCNSLDDDCDGGVDEGDGTTPAPPDGLGTPVGNSCGTNGCSVGTVQCIDHDANALTPNELQCVTATTGDSEVCDGLDNDCDTIIDEGIPGVGVDCYPSGQPGCTPNGTGGFDCEGICRPGSVVCTPPITACSGAVGPAPVDDCNGIDDDCDGNVDEGATCPGTNTSCLGGQCVFPCASTEFPCPFGFYCQDTSTGKFCTPDPCTNVNCPVGFECEVGVGTCKDLCEGVICNPGETCTSGVCLDCFELGCAANQVCVLIADGVGECRPDPCAGVECDDGTFCNNGACVPFDLCADVDCADQQVCDPATGLCVGSQCAGVFCPQGEVCRPSDGECIADPCTNVTCPDDRSCEILLDGTASCVGETTVLITAAGGGGCSSSPDGTGSLWMIGVVALWFRRRRDKRLTP